VFIDQKVMAEGALRTVFLYPYAMSFVATGLIWQWILNPNWASRKCCTSWAWPTRFDWIVDQDMAIYTIVIATVWQASGLVMALMLSGLRGVDEEIWKAARIDGIPRWRVYLSIVLPMLGPSVSTAFVLLFVMVVKVFDAVVAMTQGGPGTASEVPAKFIMDYLFGRANIGLASAASIVLLLTVLAIVAPLYLCVAAVLPKAVQHERRLETAPHAGLDAGPHGRVWLPDRGGAVLPAAAVRDAGDVGEADGRNPPRHAVRAAAALYAGALGAGLVVGLHGPGMQRHQGRLLELGRHRGAEHHPVDRHRRGERLCAVVLASARRGAAVRHPDDGRFIPVQVMIYPLVRVLAAVNLFSSLPGIVLIHTIFGMPVMTLLFRNYYAALPLELFKAARIDGGGFWRIFLQLMLPMSTPVIVVAVIMQVTGIWNDFLLGLVFAGSEHLPMTVQLNNIINTTTGERLYNVNMAATILTSVVPLALYFISGRWFVRGIASGAVKG
jgi:ABC-type sugar transport system permease subunit